MKKSGRADGSASYDRQSRSVLMAVLLVLVVLLSLGSGLYAGASFFPQQAPNLTITTTIFTTTTSWTTSTIWSTVTSVVQGILTTVTYTTSTSTVTVTGHPTGNYGDTSIESTARGVGAGYIVAATRFTTSSPMTITQFNMYFYASPLGNIKFAVYLDSGGTPAGQSLVGQTNGYAIGGGTGWHNYVLSSDQIYIGSSGTYWLCFLLDTTNGGQFRSNALGTGQNYFAMQSYASGFPATFASSPLSINYGDFSFYATAG